MSIPTFELQVHAYIVDAIAALPEVPRPYRSRSLIAVRRGTKSAKITKIIRPLLLIGSGESEGVTCFRRHPENRQCRSVETGCFMATVRSSAHIQYGRPRILPNCQKGIGNGNVLGHRSRSNGFDVVGLTAREPSPMRMKTSWYACWWLKVFWSCDRLMRSV
ncbi:hypothetical protein BDY19DRAFT_346779 [Irpex rosettiformis]|uniref:Uncharacterized protein n=1 Tax=Irpex rosettiformis TaxID=378272 RepID=A0ACB8TWQ0_9APHY|nr:hypothetical protein BDY19DRAFT_346779 [Irpex rosettiformis]